jgi:dipeptidyl aminopeptidase/acylaminoacyl peptidase
MTTTAPYGSWRSPITADLLVQDAVRLGQVRVAGDAVLWNEGRPSEAGRDVVVRRAADGTVTDVVPAGFAARTLVHEYGGISYAVVGDDVVFSNFEDQRLYRLAVAGGAAPVALTAAPPDARSVRFADVAVSPDGEWLVAVRERHLGSSAEDVVNDLVAVPADGGEPVVVVGGGDFYAAPRLSPDGTQLCWLTWDHPNMPWDATTLWVAPFSGGTLTGAPRVVAGGEGESVTQPRWSPDGVLHFVSDRSGWWNLYREGDGASLCPMEAEFSGPDWVFGQSTYVFLADGSLVAVWSEGGVERLGLVAGGRVSEIETPWTAIDSLGVVEGGVVAVAASPTHPAAVVRIDVPAGTSSVLRRSRPDTVEPAYVSVPEAIEFPTEGGRTAHAFFYPPANPQFAAPEGERPPLVVKSHGGPTSAARAIFDMTVQYWTSRGIAVVDVNYGGSTGYGREYRRRLNGAWGIVDVDDCVNAARWLAAEGRVDGDRMVVRGGSAGGYTTLAALTFRDVFAGGASLYGVADLEILAADTHKFESRYLDGLVGPYPDAKTIYDERSPIHHTDRLSRPMILFQGLEDKVVPPEQAEMMADALRRKGIPFAYLAFEGEQHGFRRAETIVRVAEAELWFYGRILGFGVADEIEPVRIEHGETLGS